MSQTGTIEIAFPAVNEGGSQLGTMLPDVPKAPVSNGLQLVVKDTSPAVARQTLVCNRLLVGDTRTRAEQEALKLYEQMLDNTQVFMTYGTQALAGVNQLIDRLLHEVEPTKIPELKQLMHDLNEGMREIKGKYDVSDPKVRETFAEWKGGIGRFFGRARQLIDLLMEDVTSIETQLKKVGNELHDRQYQLTRNVSYYDELYEENEAEIGNVIYAIAVMELIRDKAAADAAAIVVGDASLGDRGGEKKASLAEFASNMDIKIAEYKGRLFVAWATSPQVRMMRTLNVALAERINELLCVTIPTMRATILQWRLLIQTKDAAELSEQVQQASNDWLVAFAAAGAEVVPRVAEMVQTPTLLPQTVAAMAESVAKQAEGVVTAMENGAQRRAELDDAMLTAKKILDDSSEKISDALIDSIVEHANNPLEIATAVPVG